MWHVETDYFSLAVFLIMVIKNRLLRKERKDFQSDVFYLVLIISIITNIVDILASLSMNFANNWWVYQITMTLYVASMPLLAAVWMCYAYVLIYGKELPVKRIMRNVAFILIPYAAYALSALSNPFTGLYFGLSPEIEYSRGPLFMPVGVGSIMAYSAAGLIMVIARRKKIQPRINVLLLMTFFVTTACFIWIQLANPGWLIINASYALVYIWCDITVEDQRRRELYDEISRKNAELEEIAIELKKTADEAERANHAKTDFLRRMSHDIRTPLNGIIGLLKIDETHKDDMELIWANHQKIQLSADHLLSLINDMLQMSKLEDGKVVFAHEPVDLGKLAVEIITIVEQRAAESGISLIYDQQEAELKCRFVYGSPLHLRQLFLNIYSNCIKYNHVGGTVITNFQFIGISENKVTYRWTITDNGIGMSTEFIEHIFEPFAQERSDARSVYHGTGLGMAIVKSLVDNMGGTIKVESVVGEGSKFIITIPFEMADQQEVTTISEKKPADIRGMRLLLAEDNELNSEIAEMLLTDAGAQVTIVRDGQQAVNAFAEHPAGTYDAILMDIMMPNMDGITASRTIRALGREDAGSIPIIAMTANAFDDDAKDCFEAGMNAHLSKPLQIDTMLAAISQFSIRNKSN